MAGPRRYHRLRRRSGGRCGRGRAAACLRPFRTGRRLRSWPVALVATPKLLLRMPALVLLRGDRARHVLSVGLARSAGAGLHHAAAHAHLGHPAIGGAHARQARRGLSGLPEPNQRADPAAAERSDAMTFMQRLSNWGEGLPVPDAVSRMVIASLVGRTDRSLATQSADAAAFARGMAAFPIAVHTDTANTQHYEVPAAFFDQVLGARRKYSCCYYADPGDTLATAEETALTLTAEHADLADGQDILELGCGWGSLSLWMAERYPKARIVSVSNSASQRAFIEEQAVRRRLVNLRVVTADMNDFASEERFDRVVSVEMFEHMANWQALLGRIHGWLKPDGRLFFHVFAHAQGCYRFDAADTGDWIAQHFFTGGLMPSAALAHQFPDLFAVEA